MTTEAEMEVMQLQDKEGQGYRQQCEFCQYLDLKLLALRAIREHSSVLGDFPGGPVVNTPPFNAEGKGLIPGQGIKVPHVTWYGQKIKIKFCCFKPPRLCICGTRPGCLIYLSKFVASELFIVSESLLVR